MRGGEGAARSREFPTESQDRLRALHDLQNPCRLCPRECGARRAEGETGFCGAAADATIASYGPHYGEESVLVGAGGSGTIFLSGCNLKCAFCQNYDISAAVVGEGMRPSGIARLMLALAARGCENVNFVTPTHHAPQIADATAEARARGFDRPVVYNCGGYEGLEALRLLDGTVDIYMPDAKFLDAAAAGRYLGAADYPERMRAAIIEMQRQVGALVVENGVAVRGLLVRHLAMPGCEADSKRVLDFLRDEIGPGTYVNVMGQYRPAGRAERFPEINRFPDAVVVRGLKAYAREKGLRVDE